MLHTDEYQYQTPYDKWLIDLLSLRAIYIYIYIYLILLRHLGSSGFGWLFRAFKALFMSEHNLLVINYI